MQVWNVFVERQIISQPLVAATRLTFSEAASLCGTLELYKEGFLGLLLRPEQLFQVVLSSNG